MKKKDCERCKKSFTKMYRVRYIESLKNWVFMCESCLLEVSKTISFINTGGPGKVNLSNFVT